MTTYRFGFLVTQMVNMISKNINAVKYKALYKYTNEALFCLGVAKVTLLDGTIVGQRVRIFDYSSKKIVSIAEFTRRINEN